jgi:hypothetical protein
VTRAQDCVAAKALDKGMGGLPKFNVCHGSSLVIEPRGTYQILQRTL